jgi:hypothetical protein
MKASIYPGTRAWLIAGIIAPLYYVVMNIVADIFYPGYSSVTQTISELSAIGAPTRTLWILMGLVYSALMIAFIWAVWQAGHTNKQLRRVARLLFIATLIGTFVPSMHVRGAQTNVSDLLHAIFGGAIPLFFIAAMLVGANAFDRAFKIYTYVSVGLMIFFGILTGIEAPGIVNNLPTPMIGVWERLVTAFFMAWVVVVAIKLLNKEKLSEHAVAEHHGTIRFRQHPERQLPPL